RLAGLARLPPRLVVVAAADAVEAGALAGHRLLQELGRRELLGGAGEEVADHGAQAAPGLQGTNGTPGARVQFNDGGPSPGPRAPRRRGRAHLDAGASRPSADAARG